MKKKINHVLLLALPLTVLFFSSCKKSSTSATPSSSGAVNLVNAVVGGATVTVVSTPNLTFSNNTLGNNAAAWFPLAGGQNAINIGVPAIAATSTSPAIPAVTYFNTTLGVSDTSNYSLFLTGASASSIDHVLIQESYPRAYGDSIFGVRFINLVTGSNPISVDIKGGVNGSELASLAYLSYSGFNQHPALKANPSYIFEFRDAASGSLLTSYTLTTPYFHNVTLCLKGKAGAYGVILDPDY